MLLGGHDALVVVDVQNDFLPRGALPVPDGDAVVRVLNRYIRLAVERGAHVFATRDWHPPGHCSFRERGGPWPPHCVQGTPGAEFAPDLRLPTAAVIVSKGTSPQSDAYSAFEATKFETVLRALEVERLLVGGLATDYCVMETVRDGLARGLAVLWLEDASRGIAAATSARAKAEMARCGAIPITFDALTTDPVVAGPPRRVSP